MYTSVYGDRRVRVFNIALGVSDQLHTYYKAANNEALCAYLIRKHLLQLETKGSRYVKQQIIDDVAELLTKYR